MTYAPPGLSCPRITTRAGAPQLSRLVAGRTLHAARGHKVA